MNLSQFLEHWSIVENPFRGEEARNDAVFTRMAMAPAGSGAGVAVAAGGGAAALPNGAARSIVAVHSDFEKILGQIDRPSTAIVFGEKGSGKTAIRLQIADRLAAHNAQHPEAKVLLVAYDDLNAVLDRFHERMGGKDPLESFEKFRLVDHIDAILGQVVPRIVDTLLNQRRDQEPIDLGPEARRVARRLDPSAKRDLLLLQAIYDRPDSADLRTGPLRRVLRVPLPREVMVWRAVAVLGWLLPVGVVAAYIVQNGWAAANAGWVWQAALAVAALIWLAGLFKVAVWDRLAGGRLARKVRKQVRVLGRNDGSYVRSLGQLDAAAAGAVPTSDSDETRYAMLDRLRRLLRAFGYAGVNVIIDRVDEPTLVSGEERRMRAVIWPMFNNKFLQQGWLGIKMLLPIELRHALFKESSVFFQEARLDKQNMVERLSWTGAMLFDLCDARLKACLAPGATPVGLLDLFAEDVTRQDLVDALDQMHQPRDAFKFLYQCITEHCSNVTSEQGQWRVPRLILETVKKQQAERVQGLYRGIRPA
jgi:hypothetical protein